MLHKSALASQPQKDILEILAKINRLESESSLPAYKAAAAKASGGFDGHKLPVVAVAVYRKDILVMRRGEKIPTSADVRRGEIKEMSNQSLRRLAFLAQNTDTEFRSMLTLTYPNEFPSDGETVKRHLAAMLRSLKRRLGDPLTYVWFLEFQRRGAPHIHILLQVGLTPGDAEMLRNWVSRRWFDIVQSGDDLHLLAGTSWQNTRVAEGMRRYVTKYAFKTYQKEVPDGFTKVGRFWGASRNVRVEPILVQVSDEEGVRCGLADWDHRDCLEAKIPRVLYNAASYWTGLEA